MKTSFKHASADRNTTDSVWVEITRDNTKGVGEGCPRSYVTGETSEGALQWIESIRGSLIEVVTDLDSLRVWSANHEKEINSNLAAWCAVEIAFLDLFAQETDSSVEALLGLPETTGDFKYTAVVSDETGEKLKQILGQYLHYGFQDYKFKLSGKLESDLEKLDLLHVIAEHFDATHLRIRIDGNNLWESASSARDYLASLKVPFSGIEEPISARDYAGLSELSQALKMPIILDESACRIEDLDEVSELTGEWIPNIRISKMGGILRSLDILSRAKEYGFKVIVGAQVGETSVLTRAALIIASQAGDHLFAQEGAFGTLLIQKDAVEPVLMFGKGGRLTFPPANQAIKGMGLHPIL